MGNIIRRIKLEDGTVENQLASVDTSGNLSVKDSEAGTKLDTLDTSVQDVKTSVDAVTTAVQAVETNQTDKTQFTKITDGINDLNIKANGTMPVDLPISAFGDLQTAELTPILQHSFEYTVDNTEILTNTITAGGTVTQSNGMAVIGSSTTTGSDAFMKSRRHAKYRPGLGGMMRFTALFETSVASTEQYVGLADDRGSSEAFNNGFMIGYDGTTFGLHRFQNDVKTTVALSNWDDPLDGTGESGMTLDNTKLNVWFIRFQYLGAGKIDILVEDDSTGLPVVVHSVLYANNNTTPSVYNPNFHLSFFVDNKATTTNLVVKTASMAYFIEGKTKYYELHQPQFSTGKQQATTVTTSDNIVTIRNKASYASKTNFIDIILERVSVSIEASSANNLGEIRLVRNATLGGTPSYTDINTSDSIVDYDVSGTTVTNGKTLDVISLAGKNDSANIDLTPYDIILAPGETLSFEGVSVNSATINVTVLWKELF